MEYFGERTSCAKNAASCNEVILNELKIKGRLGNHYSWKMTFIYSDPGTSIVFKSRLYAMSYSRGYPG